MAQPVSTKFANAQDSPANLPVAKVQLALGNYCSAATYGTTAVASSSDPSGDFPASGSIDGDRTEINVGAPASADNGVGKSSWRSGTPPTPSSPQTLTITFSQARTINRVKLYQPLNTGHGIVSYKAAYYNGSSYVVFAATPDLGIPNVFVINTLGYTLDQIDFPDVTTTQLLFTFYNVIGGDNVNVIEVEAYRLIDITSRVKGIKLSRQRDYKLANPMAASVQLDCINTDRFFSISHAPTAAEIAAGFVNSELRPNLPIYVSFGFNLYGSGPELVPAITAYLDAITPKPRTRDCRITGRDGLKGLINQTDSTNLKQNIELSQAVRYVLNRGNVSDFEMALGVTNIIIPYFFGDNQDHLTTIRDLTQAAGDSLFYVNESGQYVFQFYTGNLPLDFTYPSQAAWASGTLTGNMEVNGSNQLQLNVQFTDTQTFSDSLATSHTDIEADVGAGPQPQSFAQSFQLPYDSILDTVQFTIIYQSNGGQPGTFYVYADNGGTPGAVLFSGPVAMTDSSFNPVSLLVSVAPNLSLAAGKYWYGLTVGLVTQSCLLTGGTVVTLVTPQTAPVLQQPYPATLCEVSGGSGTWVRITFHSGFGINIVSDWGHYSFGGATGSGTWTSPVLDTGTATTSFRPLIPTSVPNGNTIQYLTQSSPDGVHWSGFVPTAANGQPLSPLARYFQSQVSMTQNVLSGVSALVLDLEINWIGGLGQLKYPNAPSSFTFNYNSNLIDVSQELADNLGGDTSIVNNITVQAAPLILTGNDTDTAWQGTIGVPPVNISAGTPLTVTAGTPIVVAPYISGGMDISRMSGANPAAAVVTFGAGAAGTWQFTAIHPTLPVLVITPTISGVISDLRITGKSFSSQSTLQAAIAADPSSIQQFGNRQQSIQNTWITSFQIAQAIATNLLSVFSKPFSYIPSFTVQPTFSMQIGDRITVHDVNLDLSADYITVGIDHEFSVRGERGSVQTTGKLLAVPAGF